MKIITAADVMAIPPPLRRCRLDERILLPVYYPFVVSITKQCGMILANCRHLRTTDEGFTYNKLRLDVLSAMVWISQGKTWEAFDEEIRRADMDHMEYPGPMSDEFYRSIAAIYKQRERIVRCVPELVKLAERALKSIHEPSIRLIDLQANLRLATWQFNEEDIHAFLSRVPLTVRDNAVVRVTT